MNCTLYLPYLDYDDDRFTSKNDYYSCNDYSVALEENYNKDKDIVYNTMNDFQSGKSVSFGFGTDSNIGGYKDDDEQVIYSKCKATLLSETNEEETIDSIIEYFKSEDVFITLFKLRFDEMDEEFEEDLKMWYDSHVNINKYDADEDWKLLHEPTRNVKFTFANLSGDTSYGELLNCKILQKVGADTFAVLVDKIIFIKEF